MRHLGPVCVAALVGFSLCGATAAIAACQIGDPDPSCPPGTPAYQFNQAQQDQKKSLEDLRKYAEPEHITNAERCEAVRHNPACQLGILCPVPAFLHCEGIDSTGRSIHSH